jgi:hypothetical protein
MLDPRTKLFPAPIVHAGFASLAALSTANEEGTALGIQITLSQVKSLADSKASSPEDDDQAANPRTMDAATRLAHDRHDLLDSWWIGRVAQSLVPRRST